jgi:uncharacterized protein YggE
MTEPNRPVLSVRGEARQTVAPDSVVLPGALTVSAGSKPEVLRAAAGALESLTADLRSLGGVPLTVDSERNPLTWSAFSASTHAEGRHDPTTGAYVLTGRVTASVAVITTVRDFALLDQLSDLLAHHEQLSTHHAGWEVDADNPAWPQVRAAAIHSAIRKGRDYAAALGGSLLEVLHIADVGLLGGEGSDAAFRRSSGTRYAVSAAALGAAAPDAPSLDPVPQELTATIEARFTTTGISLVED